MSPVRRKRVRVETLNARPRTNTYGRPRNAEPPRHDGFSEGTCRNVIGRYGARRVRYLIKAWAAGEKTDAELGANFGISGSVMRRWRRAFGIRRTVWTMRPEINALHDARLPE